MAYKISGTVKESTASVTRSVRLYNRDTGALLDSVNSISGDFEFTGLTTDDQVQVVCIDDEAGTVYNDLIYRSVPIEV